MGEAAIRAERPADRSAVHAIHEAVFSDGEAGLVDTLRASGDLVLSLVAEVEDAVVGHVAYSRGYLDNRPVVMLGPVGVRPGWQGQGIGRQLIEDGNEQLAAAGEAAIFVVGDARYYARFGFEAGAAARFSCAYAGPHFMVLECADGALPASGTVRYSAAFAAFD